MNSKASKGNPNPSRKSKMNTKIKEERNTMKNGKLNGKVAS